MRAEGRLCIARDTGERDGLARTAWGEGSSVDEVIVWSGGLTQICEYISFFIRDLEKLCTQVADLVHAAPACIL